MSIHDTSQVRYKFVGGPLDGEGIVETGGEPVQEDMVYVVLVEGSFVYMSNGPVSIIEDAIVLHYKGKHVETYQDRPDVFFMMW